MMAAVLHQQRTLTRERVEWHLWNWERWMHHSRSPGLLPGRASGGIIGRSGMDFDEMADGMDRDKASTCDAVIDGIPQRLKFAIHAHHGIAVWRIRGNLFELYEEACDLLAVGFYKRGLE